jgi:hypothetical protein
MFFDDVLLARRRKTVMKNVIQFCVVCVFVLRRTNGRCERTIEPKQKAQVVTGEIPFFYTRIAWIQTFYTTLPRQGGGSARPFFR